MSDDEENEKPKTPEPEPNGKKFFISHVNSYTGRYLHEELKNAHEVKEERAAHTFIGTLESGKNHIYTMQAPMIPEGVEKVVKMERTRDFRESILESDVIIYDLMTDDYDEVDYVIKTLKTSQLTQKKTLVILSSVMTWVNTPPKFKKENDEEGEGEEGGDGGNLSEETVVEGAEEGGDDVVKPPRVVPFKESDYNLRVPHERYFKHKNLETLAMSAPKTQPLLKVHILCCGVRYGHGEGIFYDHFKNAWMQSPAQLAIIGEGKNRIPTLHVRDVCRCVKKLVDKNLDKVYIFAVDRSDKPSQKNIVEAISKGIGTGKVRHFESKDISDSIIWKDFLGMNLKMRSSDIFDDSKDIPEDVDQEDPVAMAPYRFPWWSEKGLIVNAGKLNVEFNEARFLEPVKIFITGPPASGKSFYGNKISKHYNIPRVHVKELSDEAYKMLAMDDEDVGENEMIASLKAKIDELKDEVIAKMTEENENTPDWEAPEKENVTVRIPDEFIYQILQDRLKQNDCRNRGYILDGYPRTHTDAQHVFLKRPPPQKDEDGNDIEVEIDPEAPIDFSDFIKVDEVFPSSTICLSQKDQFLIDRVKELSEEEIKKQANFNITDMKRRLKTYRKNNESQVADPSVQQFFKNKGILCFEKDAKIDDETIMNSLQIYIERISAPNNFLSQTESIEAKRRILVQKDIMQQTEIAQMRVRMEDGVERELKKQKEKHTKENNQAIREDQKEKLDSKSQPIRQYLNDNLVPILTDGLIDICKLQPEDAVDALAEYLFKRSLDVPYPDPCSYIE